MVKTILKVLSIVIITMLFSINVIASEDILSLESVINTSIENSTQLSIDSMKITNAQNVHKTAKDEADNILISNIENEKWFGAFKDPAYCASQRKLKEVVPLQRENDTKVLIKTKKAHENKIKVDAYNIYYSLIKANKQIEFNTAYADLMKQKLEISKQKYNKGLISKNDYELTVLEKENADIEIDLAIRDRKKYISKLYALMGQGYQPDIKKLEANLDYSKIEITVEEAIKNAFANRIEIFQADKNEEFKELEFEIDDRYFDDDDIEYNTSINDYESAKLSSKTTRDNVEYEIRTSYNNLLNSLDTIKINSNEVMKKDILYFISKLKYELKMITEFELNQAEIEVESAKLTLDNSIIDYIVDKFEFEILQDIGSL